jgi:hypothetical protein
LPSDECGKAKSFATVFASDKRVIHKISDLKFYGCGPWLISLCVGMEHFAYSIAEVYMAISDDEKEDCGILMLDAWHSPFNDILPLELKSASITRV